MIRFGILLFDGFDELDAIGPWEVLRTAAEKGAPFDVQLFTLADQRVVHASHGLRLASDGLALGERRFDWVLLPGGGWSNPEKPGAGSEIRRGELPRLLRTLHQQGAALASVCTGGMLLAAAGVVEGRPAVTHAIARQALAAAGARVVEARVVDDGDLVSAGGVTSGLDLALWLTERLAGPQIAQAVATEMEHRRVGGVYRGPGAMVQTAAAR